MSLSYRHKQTVIIFIVCILGVGAAGYAVYGKSWQNKTPNIPKSEVLGTAPAEAGAISDTNDWKKPFLMSSTSTKNTLKSTAVIETEPEEPETVTGQFGKRFLEQYMILKQNNLIDNQEAVKAVIDQGVDSIVSSAPQPRTYDVRNIIVAKSDDKVSRKIYANSVGNIISTYMPKDDAAIIATKALEEEDKDLIKKIETTASSYATMLSKILEVPTPKSLLNNQIGLVNSISSMSFVSDGMSKVFSDPIQGLVALAIYEKSLLSLQNSFLDLKYAFSTDNIEFSSTDPGIIFTLIK